jgi:hypothetical protein
MQMHNHPFPKTLEDLDPVVRMRALTLLCDMLSRYERCGFRQSPELQRAVGLLLIRHTEKYIKELATSCEEEAAKG